MTAPDGFVYGPTPLEAADHIKKWEAMRKAGVEGLPGCAVEWQWGHSGRWGPDGNSAAWWRTASEPEVRRLGLRLVPLPVVPPVPVVVKVEDANDAHALIGRSIDGKVVGAFSDYGDSFALFSKGVYILARDWGESVSVDPEPPPAPVEPDTVNVELPRHAAEFYAAMVNATEVCHQDDPAIFDVLGPAGAAVRNACQAALAAEGDRR